MEQDVLGSSLMCLFSLYRPQTDSTDRSTDLQTDREHAHGGDLGAFLFPRPPSISHGHPSVLTPAVSPSLAKACAWVAGLPDTGLAAKARPTRDKCQSTPSSTIACYLLTTPIPALLPPPQLLHLWTTNRLRAHAPVLACGSSSGSTPSPAPGPIDATWAPFPDRDGAPSRCGEHYYISFYVYLLLSSISTVLVQTFNKLYYNQLATSEHSYTLHTTL